MRKLALVSLAALTLTASAVQASNTDPIYYPDTGTLILPNLKLGTATYSVVLHRLGNTGFDFRLDTTQVVGLNLSNLGYTPPAASEIVGTWVPSGIDKTGTYATFNANGTYTMEEGVSVPADTDCPKGGTETGTYQYEPTTGVFTATATTDNNGPNCGFSGSGDVKRFKKVGTDIYIFFTDDGQYREVKLIKQ
ncbi:MAG TPA: hypothetical protein VMH83_04420 [Candidatus Acidoferrum sp.]|nr:hypothetical protein [Candidatus Acidoferrum sp.]